AVHDTFVERLVEATRSLIIGPAWEPSTFIGPLIEAEAKERVLRTIERGRSEGRPVLVGSVPEHAESLGGFYVAPAIFTDVRPDATIAREEIFGPVVAVMKARDFDEALAMAN